MPDGFKTNTEAENGANVAVKLPWTPVMLVCATSIEPMPVRAASSCGMP